MESITNADGVVNLEAVGKLAYYAHPCAAPASWENLETATREYWRAVGVAVARKTRDEMEAKTKPEPEAEIRRLEDELANTRGAFSRATKRADELEKTSALWCERFLETTKANTEIGMMLVEYMVRYGVEPPDDEQAAVAARETRAEENRKEEYISRGCRRCGGTGFNGDATKELDATECAQCYGRGVVFVRESDARK